MYMVINLTTEEILGAALSLNGAMRLAIQDILSWGGLPCDIDLTEEEHITISCDAENLFGEPLKVQISETVLVP